MSGRRSVHRESVLVRDALPLAGRAADVRAARVLAMLRDAAVDRDDLRQEVLVRVWAALPQFDPGRASLRTFIETVASSGLASILRRNAAKKRIQPAGCDPVEGQLHLLVSIDLQVDVGRMLRELNPDDKQVVQHLLANGPARVARILGTSRAAVYRSIGRIRTALAGGGYC